MRNRALVVTTTLALLYASSPARANGRYPAAQMIVTTDTGQTVVLRTTFGLLLSRDRGASWRWVCEQAIGFDGAWDPPVTATRDGRIFVGLSNGLRVTTGGCAFDAVHALDGEQIADLTLDATGDHVVAVTSTPGKPAFVWHESARGVLERLGKGVSGFGFDTVEVARARPTRVYLTAVPESGGGVVGHFFRSDDGGATLVDMPLRLPRDGRLFVSGVDPKNADRVFVRQLHQEGSELLLSSDGGKTFRVVLHTDASMPGFAMSDDGADVYAGSANSKEGVFRSSDRGEHFAHVGATSVKCLHADGARLYACSDPFPLGGYAVAVSVDRGATMKSLTSFEIAGAIACDGGAGAECASKWGEVRASLAATASAVLAPPPAPETPEALSAAEADAAAPPARAPAPAPRRACGCRVVGALGARGDAGAAGGEGAHTWMVVGVCVVISRRRRFWIARTPAEP